MSYSSNAVTSIGVGGMDFVFVVALVVIASQSDKDVDITLVQDFALTSSFDVHEHSKPLVHPHVKSDVAGRSRISIFKATHQEPGLFIQPPLIQVRWIIS